MKEKFSLANFGGFWGDQPEALTRILNSNKKPDYLVADYLSEVTLGLLAKRKAALKDKVPGFIEDFAIQIEPHLADLAKKKIKLITNAGGLAPADLAAHLRIKCKEKSLDLNIMALGGDDILAKIENNERFLSAHAYIGAFPIAAALEMGADIIITGRASDSALALGPMIFEYQLSADDLDLLAAGSLAGHLIECGTQLCGGNHTDWQTIAGLAKTSFPFLEIYPDGKLILEKFPAAGGTLNRLTVLEQLLYEISDPSSYPLSDITCDFSNIIITELGNDRVEVKGALGKLPPEKLKGLAVSQKGYRLSATMVYRGLASAAKIEKSYQAIIGLIEEKYNCKLNHYHIEYLGGQISRSPAKSYADDQRDEVVGILNIAHENKKLLNDLAAQIAPCALAMAPGLISLLGGRPKAAPYMVMEAFSLARDKIEFMIHTDGDRIIYSDPIMNTSSLANKSDIAKTKTSKKVAPKFKKGATILQDIAVARSGDKGAHANIGVIAREQDSYQSIISLLTPQKIADFFNHPIEQIDLYEVEALGAINIVLRDFLDGGGLASMLVDAQGKGLAQELLSLSLLGEASREKK